MTDHLASHRLASLLDDLFKRRAEAGGAVSVSPPLLLDPPFLEALGHPDEAPHPPVAVPGTSSVLPSATCYRLFQALAGGATPDPPTFTLSGPCFRVEEPQDATRRLAFTMRETVFFGPEATTDEFRTSLMKADRELTSGLGLEVEIRQATDPFFLSSGGRGRRILQKLLQLKYEMVVEVTGRTVAVASFNLHRQHFSARLDIGSDENRPSSGCVAYGIERWAVALTERWGEDLSRWPRDVRTILGEATR